MVAIDNDISTAGRKSLLKGEVPYVSRYGSNAAIASGGCCKARDRDKVCQSKDHTMNAMSRHTRWIESNSPRLVEAGEGETNGKRLFRHRRS